MKSPLFVGLGADLVVAESHSRAAGPWVIGESAMFGAILWAVVGLVIAVVAWSWP
jgi:hypothetical protein